MDIQAAIENLEEQPWLDEASTDVQKIVGDSVRSGGEFAKKIKNFLNGTWLGHPVHPIMTDVAVGGYTTSWLLDILAEFSDSDTLRQGADQAMVVGMLGSVASIVTGLADWADLDGKARNIGLVHATTNATANLLYLSAYLNKDSNRNLRFWLAMGATSVLMVGAYLGGHLVYEEQIGVDHSKGQPYPEKFTAVMPLNELEPDQLTMKEVNGAKILLVKQNDEIYALSEVCTHLGGPLAQGTLGDDCSVTCPWHGSRFALDSGEVLDGPASHPAPCFQTRIRNGQIEIKLD